MKFDVKYVDYYQTELENGVRSAMSVINIPQSFPINPKRIIGQLNDQAFLDDVRWLFIVLFIRTTVSSYFIKRPIAFMMTKGISITCDKYREEHVIGLPILT
ncbi:MAG: hypothetical protein WB612_07035 [Nitrososphaeraceae archaeon]